MYVFLSDSVHRTDRPNYIDKSWEAPVVGTFSGDISQEHYHEYKPPHQLVNLVTQPTQIEGVKICAPWTEGKNCELCQGA